jgi:hypothetical protein
MKESFSDTFGKGGNVWREIFGFVEQVCFGIANVMSCHFLSLFFQQTTVLLSDRHVPAHAKIIVANTSLDTAD